VQFDSRAYAFEIARAQAYAEELLDDHRDLSQSSSWQSLRSSLTAAFQAGSSPVAVSSNANRAIAASIMQGLPASWFDGHCVMHSLWLERMDHTAQNAAGLVEEALLEGFHEPAVVRFDGAQSELGRPKY